MTKYELSISADYVPEWGIVEAVREFFQNALDEETRDSKNKMFFEYNKEQGMIRIGNKSSNLDIKTLLFGVTSKSDNPDMIGNYGEGYKLATTVLLRCQKTVVFENYCKREIWRPRLVKSKKYGGVLVPTFFVEKAAFWEKVPEQSLIIKISGITPEEYEQIKKSNLYLQGIAGNQYETKYGSILKEACFKGKIFVGGLYVCTDPELQLGVNFKPNVVRLERNRNMANNFDVQMYISNILERLDDPDLIEQSLDCKEGRYIYPNSVAASIRDKVAENFVKQYGERAVPVSEQEEADQIRKRGYQPVIVAEARKKVILASSLYTDMEEEEEISLYERFQQFINKIESRLDSDEKEEADQLLEKIEQELGR